MIRFIKDDILEELKQAGYSTFRLRKEKIMGESVIQKIRTKDTTMSLKTIDTICKILDCQINDIIEFVPDRESVNNN